jgi:hypothetical protein
MNFYSPIFLFSITAFLCSCAGDNIKRDRAKPYINTNLAYNEPITVEYFIDHYKNEKIVVYEDEQKKVLLNQTTPNLENMQFLSKSDIFNLVGSPVLIKNENNIEIWQYRSELCIFNVIWHNNSIPKEQNPKNKDSGVAVPAIPTNEIIAYNQDTKSVKIQECAKYLISHNTH